MAEIHVQSETPPGRFSIQCPTQKASSQSQGPLIQVETPDEPELLASFPGNITHRMSLGHIGRPVCSVSPTSSGDEKGASRVARTFPECAAAGVGRSHVEKLPR